MPSATNPILMELSGNGSLAGRDRAGAFTATGSGALRYAPAPGARVNLATNARFANDASRWQTNGGPGASIARVADARFSGGFACRVFAPGDQAYRGLVQSPASQVLNAPDSSVTQVTISFDIIVESGPISGLQAGTNSYSANNAFLATPSNANFSVSALNSLERKSLTMNANATLYSGSKIVAYVLNGHLADSQFLISNIVLEFGNVTNATYFENPNGWLDPRTGMLGTPHASPSVSRAQFWVEEATTNLIINPSFGTNTTSWGTYSDRTITRDTTTAYIGSASCKVASSLLINADAFAMTYSPGITAAGAGSYTWSAWVFVPTTWTGGSICLDVRDFVGGTGAGLKAYANMSTKGVWQRVTNTFTVVGGDLTGNLYVGVDTQWKASEFFYITNIQLEAKAYATSFADGSLGTGYTWAGTAHASESTRAMASIVMPQTADRISPVSGALAARFQRGSASVGDKRIIRIGLESAGFDAVYLFIKSSTLDVYERWVKDGVTGTEAVVGSIVANVRQIAYIDWLLSSTTLNSELSGGGLVTLYPQMAGDFNNASGFIAVGSLHTSAQSLNGLIGPVAIYDRPLTDAERLMVNNAIDSDGNLWTVLGGSNILIPLTARRRQH